jgi:hypothetical protein
LGVQQHRQLKQRGNVTAGGNAGVHVADELWQRHGGLGLSVTAAPSVKHRHHPGT